MLVSRTTATWLLLAACLLTAAAPAHEHGHESVARYLANEGLMVADGDTKVLFDPLFNESFGHYRLVPERMRAALMAGEAPWDGIDAVFISHYHDDHFAPADVIEYLRLQRGVHLYAPVQAVDAMRDVAGGDDEVFTRVTEVLLEYGDEPKSFAAPNLKVEAVRIPHSGWPTDRLDVQNIAWRVTLNDATTVVHLGDSDTRDVHFSHDEEYWDEVQPNMAFPPYWFFLSGSGRAVLDERLRPMHAVGIHVPTAISGEGVDDEPDLQGVDLFTRPGETREIPHDD